MEFFINNDAILNFELIAKHCCLFRVIDPVSSIIYLQSFGLQSQVVLSTIAGELAALRPRYGLRLTSYSSFNFRHLWLHFLDASSDSR